MKNLFKFLQAAMSLSRKGVKQEDILKFAKQEFGEVTDEIKQIINRIYARNKSQKPKTKDQKKGEVVPFRDKNNLTEDDPMGDLEKIVRNEGDVGLPKDEGIMSTDEADLQKKIMDQVNEAYGKKGMQEDMPETFNLSDQVREQLGYPNRMIEGAVRTAARELLLEKGINVTKGKDPITTFRQVFGEDALDIVDGLQDELLEVSNFPELKKLLQENKLYDLEPKTGVNIEETKEVEEITEFDPKGRKPNSEGGINRLGFFAGTTKLPKLIKKGKGAFSAAQVLIERLKNTIKAMPEDEYVQNTFPNFIKEIEENPKLAENKQVQEALGFRDLPKNQRLVEYDDGTFDFFTKGSKKGMDSTKQLSDELGISMEEAIKIKQMEPEDQVLEIERRRRLLDRSRTKQAMGTGPDGLSEITELFEKIKIKNENKKAEKDSDKQIRYRKLIESNKFPELNEFFQAKLNESNGDMDLEIRMNAQTGGPFTTQQLADRRQQSYEDYLARQGKGTSTTGTRTTGTGTSGVNNVSIFDESKAVASTPATSSGTGGTSGVIPGYTNYQPNTGVTGGGTGTGTGSNPFYGKGNTGSGGTITIDKGTEETINITPPSSGGSGNLRSGKTGAEAIAAYEDYLRGGGNLSFDSFRRGTDYSGQLLFEADDFMKLQDIKKAVAGGWQSDGTYNRSGLAELGYDMKGYTGDDPRGTTDSYQYKEDMSASTSPKVTDPNRIETFEEKRKREEAEAAAEAAAKKEQEEGGGADYFPETENISQITESAKNVDLTDPSDYSQFINRNANKVVGKDSKGKIFTLDNLIKAGLFVASGGLSGGVEQAITTAAKNYAKKKAVEYAKDKFNIGTQEELPETAISVSSGLIGSPNSFSEGGRVNKAVGGPLDLEARRKQSYEDYLARQGAQPAQPVAPQPAQPAQPATPQPVPMTSGSATPTTSTTTAPQPQSTAAPQPFDMSKYQGGTFTGGIEDSRNIALGDLEELGVDVSKYRTTTATDTSGPKFKGLSINEIFAMDLDKAKDTLGFDPSVPGANAEFEEFLRVNDPGPQLIGPGGPPGMKTEFKNQDELAQILNRAIPNFMRYAKDIGENYTLDQMLAMSDDELAMIQDRYDKKMGYGKYRKTSPNIFKTGYDPDAMQQYNDVQKFMGEVKRQSKAAKGAPGNTTQWNYSTGGRVGFRYGSEDAKIKKYMKTDYSDPFNRLTKKDIGRHKAYNSAVLKKAKGMMSADRKNNKKKRNLLVLNEQARAKALERLALLKRLYGGV